MNFFDHCRHTLPADQHAQRIDAFARFEASGWPTPALESWHYSDWSSLAEQPFSLAKPALDPTFSWDRAQPLPLGSLDPVQIATGFALDALNRAFAKQGVDKTIDGHAQTPFLITHALAGALTMRHFRHRLSLSAGAKATLIVWDAPGAGDSDTLLTAVLNLALAERSHLTLIRIQNADARATRALHISAQLAADAALEMIQLDFGGARVRLETEVTLAAAGARFEQRGLTALGGKSRVDQRSVVTHAAPRCSSRSTARLIAAAQSRAILNAKVQVNPGAAKTDSETRIASLLLSDKAEIDAKPELMIDADDVQCAHGATFGQLDEDAAFYLRSRGLSADEAQGLLTLAFADTVLAALPLTGVRDWAADKVSTLLAEARA